VNQISAAQLNLADKAHKLAEYWKSQAKLWDNQVKRWREVVLFCREQRHRNEIRGGAHGKDITR
jgi:hypothetical protein